MTRTPKPRRARALARVAPLAALALVVPAAAIAAPATAMPNTSTLLSFAAETASSSDYVPLTGPTEVVDGDADTMWISSPGAPGAQWLRLDLAAPSRIDRVTVDWGTDHATDYQVQTSADGEHWQTVRDVRGSDGGQDVLGGLDARGRYLRLHLAEPAKDGYTIREVGVDGARSGAGDTQPPSTPGTPAGSATSDSITLDWTPSSDPAGVAGYQVLRGGDVVATTTDTTFTDTSLVSGVGFDYVIRAVDRAGNMSAPSAPLRATTADDAAAATTLAIAGDIAETCAGSDPGCVHGRTADMVEQLNPAGVLVLGDNQYDSGELRDYQRYYDTTWGRFLNKTYPVPGNHEYYTGAEGYKQYYGDRATPNGKTYYSFDLGGWHFVALDSNIDIGSGSAQLQWLRDDLAASTASCTAMTLHHPRFSSGAHGDDPDVRDAWQVFDEGGGDVAFAGHDHHYERFAPVTASGQPAEDGVRSAIVGTGGRGLYDIGNPHDFTEELIGGNHGIMQMQITENSYQWEFVNVDGKVMDSTPSYQCGSTTEPGQPKAEFTADCSTDQPECRFDASSSADPDGQIASYEWDFGDGQTGSGATPAHTYAESGIYKVTLTVTDDAGKTAATTKDVTAGTPPAGDKPTASFTVQCGFGSACTFDGSGSTDDRGISGYAWDFGDGQTGTGVTAKHTYESGGTFTATLTVTDKEGQTGSAERKLQCHDFAGSIYCFAG